MTYEEEDFVIPMILQGKQSCKVAVYIEKDRVSVNINGRDIEWDRKTGEHLGSGMEV
jgi:hypothetical protein